MKNKFSPSWNSSKQPRKQRKYRANAPIHLKHKMMSSHLSKELMKKYSIRNTTLRKGDTVKVVRGQFKSKTGKVEKIIMKFLKVNISGVERIKRDGSKSPYPVDPSNVIITELSLSDKERAKKLRRKNDATP